jgi:4'-phosphopantetheinyl transferase EntD
MWQLPRQRFQRVNSRRALSAHVKTVHPNAVMMAPGVVPRNPNVANRPRIIYWPVGVIGSIANCDRYRHRPICRGNDRAGAKQYSRDN